MNSKKARSIALIPARMESTRFPGKPLEKILGKPMIQWVYEAAEKSDVDDVFIATDSDEIAAFCDSIDAAYIKTSSEPLNGTERCKEALAIVDPELSTFDIIINIQGDEPLVDPEHLNRILEVLSDEESDIVTFLHPIETEEEYRDPNVVKAVPTLFEDDYCDINYFSRSPIPYMEKFSTGLAFRHIGIYGFTSTAFSEIAELEPSILETSEKLEQLRWIQNHLIVSGILVNEPYIGVDTPSDLKAVENFLTSKK